MKKFKRFTVLMLSILMLISCMMSITAFAAETEISQNEETTVYEWEITPDMVSKDGNIAIPLAIDQSFTMTTSHRGGDRTYSGNYLRYAVTITDANGNPVDNKVSVQLHDYNHSYALIDHIVPADGATYVKSNISIVSGRMYYFYYSLSTGTTRTLKIRMQITSYS